MHRPMTTQRYSLFRRILFLSTLVVSMAVGQESDLLTRLRALPDVASVNPVRGDTSFFCVGFELRVRQPLDHHHPQGKTFLQSVYLSQKGFDRPVVFVTEGYATKGGSKPGELTSLLR